MKNDDDLALAVAAYLQMFGPKLPVSEPQLVDDLFHEASEQANVVTMAIRRHNYDDFRAALARQVEAQR